jgi:hypothetical protein
MNNVMGVRKRAITVYQVGSALAGKLANLCKTDDDRAIVQRLKGFIATETDLRRAAEMLELNGAAPLAENLRGELPPEPTSKKAEAEAKRTEQAVAKALRRP